ncbi:MAG: hypothetical protein ACHQO8_04040 [Vicinamibacterales bacterium]
MNKSSTPCADVPYFDRLNYFYGQMLGVREFTAEQTYFREKLKLHNRCLHGYGTVCGLEVTPKWAPPPCDPPGEDRPAEGNPPPPEKPGGPTPEVPPKSLVPAAEYPTPTKGGGPTTDPHPDAPHVFVHCGLALDCEGNELVVRAPLKVDLVAALGGADRERLRRLPPGDRREGVTFYVSLCYCEQGLDPARPVVPDACGSTAGCEYGRFRDSVSVRVTLDPPKDDERCDVCCCGECGEGCLLLARIDHALSGKPIAPEDIHNNVRRMVGPYAPTTITGISWTHGATYSKAEVAALLGIESPKSGLVITFSRGVHVSTLTPGVIDLSLISGGGGLHGPIRAIDVGYVDLPATGYVERVTIRQTEDEPHDYGDRIFITVRSPFILDRCCRPVFGAHVGGRIPILPEFSKYDRSDQSDAVPCRQPRNYYGPWTTDPRGGPVNFESWFYIQERDKPGSTK